MDQITVFDAAHVLGTTPQEAKQLLGDLVITLDGAEALALEHYPWRAHVDDPDSYWVTVKQAAAVLGVSVPRVRQLLDAELVPHVTKTSGGGVRLMRREQLATVANDRLSRRLRRG